MSDAPADPRCPECGEPIGITATYCMHCSADLTDERQAADADADGTWDDAEPDASTTDGVHTTGKASSVGTTDGTSADRQLLDPDGLVDDSLTVVVGIFGGIVVGIVGTVVLGVLTGSGIGVAFGIVTWLVSTAYLVRQRTVQGAISKSGYAVAVVLLTVPLVAISPVVDVDGGLSARGGLFVVLLFFVFVPAGIAAGIGWVASRFVPDESSDSGTATQ